MKGVPIKILGRATINQLNIATLYEFGNQTIDRNCRIAMPEKIKRIQEQ